MNPVEKDKKPRRENLVRTVGLSLDKFQQLVEQIRTHLQAETDHNPLRKRGLKSELSLEKLSFAGLALLERLSHFYQVGTTIWHQ